MRTEGPSGTFRRSRRAPEHRQRGSLLLELMIVAAIALMAALWATHEWAERTRTLQARGLAVWMQTARDAVQAYLDLDPEDAHAGDSHSPEAPDPAPAVSGFAGVQRLPDWDALKAMGLLPAGWQPRGPLGHVLEAAIWQTGDCLRGACLRQGLVHTQQGLHQRNGAVDEALIAEWLLAAAGHGLVLWPRTPDRLSGAGRQIALSDAGLSGQQPPGTVALLAIRAGGRSAAASGGSGLGDTEDFLRMRDTRDPQFQGSLSTQGVVRSDTRLAARESLVLEEGWKAGMACGDEGALGRDRTYPGLLVCHQGAWSLVARATGGAYMVSSRRGCQNSLGQPTANPATGGCSCAAGFSAQQVSESGSLKDADGLTSGYVCVPN